MNRTTSFDPKEVLSGNNKSENQGIYMWKYESAYKISDDPCENKLTLELGIVSGSLYHTFFKTCPSYLLRCIEERMILFG